MEGRGDGCFCGWVRIGRIGGRVCYFVRERGGRLHLWGWGGGMKVVSEVFGLGGFDGGKGVGWGREDDKSFGGEVAGVGIRGEIERSFGLRGGWGVDGGEGVESGTAMRA